MHETDDRQTDYRRRDAICNGISETSNIAGQRHAIFIQLTSVA